MALKVKPKKKLVSVGKAKILNEANKKVASVKPSKKDGKGPRGGARGPKSKTS